MGGEGEMLSTSDNRPFDGVHRQSADMTLHADDTGQKVGDFYNLVLLCSSQPLPTSR